MNKHPFIFTILLMNILSSSKAFGEPEKIEHRMSVEDFKKSGLVRLTPDELSYLNSWLSIHETEPYNQKKPSTSLDTEPNKITREQAQAILNKPFTRVIKGSFRGWSGKTIFTMTNGERWQQRNGGKYYKKLESPEVSITKNNLGFYQMRINQTGRAIGVKRLTGNKQIKRGFK